MNFPICIKILEPFYKRWLLTLLLLVAFFIFLLLSNSQPNFYGGTRMGKIFQLGGPCYICPLLATLLITLQYFPCEDCSISLVTTCFHFILVASCVYWLLSFPLAKVIISRKMILTLQKIATFTFLGAGSLVSIF